MDEKITVTLPIDAAAALYCGAQAVIATATRKGVFDDTLATFIVGARIMENELKKNGYNTDTEVLFHA